MFAIMDWTRASTSSSFELESAEAKLKNPENNENIKKKETRTAGKVLFFKALSRAIPITASSS
jgi:hypothetical protein